MLDETALLSDIIQAVPIGAYWFITSDSWDDIPTILAFALEPNANEGEWKIQISAQNRQQIRQEVESHDLGEKIVHMTIESADGSHLFNSWDRMFLVVVNRTLGLTTALKGKYPALEIYEE